MRHLVGLLAVIPMVLLFLGLVVGGLGILIHLFIMDVSAMVKVSDTAWLYLMSGYILWLSLAVWQLSQTEWDDG